MTSYLRLGVVGREVGDLDEQDSLVPKQKERFTG